jgi:hypothetical protein
MISNDHLINFFIKTMLIVFIITVSLPVRIFNYFISRRQRSRELRIVGVLGVMLLHIYAAEGQKLKRFAHEYQVGFEGSFGVKSFYLSSDIAKINGLHVLEEGGTVGLVCGAKSLVAKLRQGYYYSSSSVAHTVDEIRSVVIVNFNPFYFLNPDARLRPYVTAGVERASLQMYGRYQPGAERRRSGNYEPYLGKIVSIMTTAGGGIEYKVSNPGHFVSVFAEARYGKSLRTTSSTQLFAATTTSSHLTMSVGVSFGYHQ